MIDLTPDRWRAWREVIGPGLLLGLLILLRYRYAFAEHDGLELLQLAQRTLDPGWLARDWYLDAAFDADVRRVPRLLLAGLGGLVGLEAASAAWFVALALALGVALQALGVALFGPGVLPALAAAMLADRFALLPGANHFWAYTLASTSFAMPLAVAGLAGVAAGRPGRAGLALGLAAACHVQLGLAAAGVAAIAWLARGDRNLPGLGRLALGCGLVGGPPLAWLAAELAAHRAPTGSVIEALLVRSPWHYVAVRPETAAGWGVLAGATVAFFLAWWPWRAERGHRAAAGMMAALAGLAALALVGTWLWPLPAVFKLQPLRLAPLALVLAGLYAGAGLAIAARRLAGPWPDRLALAGLLAAGLVAILALGDAGRALAAAPGAVPAPNRFFALAAAQTGSPELRALGAWFRAETAPEAVVLIPPQIEGFRFRADRAVVLDVKNNPFGDDALLAWDARLRDLAGPNDRPGASIAQLVAGYDAHDLPALRALAARYGASWIVARRAFPGEAPAFAAGPWRVYPAAP